MTHLFLSLIGRLPVGWKQLRHNPTRLITAVGGVAFANVLVFMQLGFMNALFESAVEVHKRFAADIVLSSSDLRSLREANPFPRARMMQALGVPGVIDATPVYLATLTWADPDTGDTSNFRVFGVEPDQQVFLNRELQSQIRTVRETDSALLDRLMRDFPPVIESKLAEKAAFPIESQGRTLRILGLFDQGASFDVDGSLIVSDQTFFRLFPDRSPGTPTLGLVRCEPSANASIIARQINESFPENDTKAWTKAGFVGVEQDYQARQSPIGFVFGFGVVMGVVVGLVIVYQVLSTDVQDHLSEYATLKAVGYGPGYFMGIVFEEAICLSALGFVPGMVISIILYALTAEATALPISMPWRRPVGVFVLTLMMCMLSGYVATRKLNAADPAELF